MLPFNHSLELSQIYWYTATNGFSYEIDLKNRVQKNCSTLKTRKIMKTTQGNWAYVDYTLHEYPSHIQNALNDMFNGPSRFRMFVYYALHIFYGVFFCQQLFHDFSPAMTALPNAGGYLLYAAHLGDGFIREVYHSILLIISSSIEDFFYVVNAIPFIAKFAARTFFQSTFIKYTFFSIIIGLLANALVLFLIVMMKEVPLSFSFIKRGKNICNNIVCAVFGDIVFVFQTRRKFLRLLRPSM